jgi:signal peptidase I
MIAGLFSRTVWHANAMRKHVLKLLNHQRDILAPQAIEALEGALKEIRDAVAQQVEKAALEKQMDNLEKVANKWLKPYPNAAWRENVEVLLVALAVAMGIRTFFLQPFKIPTGSMQPTLYGVTSADLLHDPNYKNVEIPTGWQRVKEWFQGTSYLHIVADNDGVMGRVEQPLRFLIFNIKQTLVIGDQSYIIWFPPDYGAKSLDSHADLPVGQMVHKGDEILKLKISAGDHLFVDRLTYNFRRPERGEIVVFETKGIPEDFRDRGGWRIPADQFYIKRLVGLGGERIQIGEDRHLRINGQRLDASTRHFERVYSFAANTPPRDSHYSGHSLWEPSGRVASFFAERPDGFLIPEDECMVMGDNTINSLDSRYWGPFPERYIIGQSFFVYWPFTSRFGWGYNR